MLNRNDWLPKSRLWLVLDRHAAQPLSLEEAASMCIAGGVDAVLCRIKDLPRKDVRELSTPVRKLCSETNTPFIMSHDIELADDLHADGIQLGDGDPSIDEVRKSLGQGIAIGYSTHSVQEAFSRHEDGADYVFLGPIFPTPAKLKYGLPLGLDVVSEGSKQLNKPVVFIGGITPDNIKNVINNGGRRIASIAALQSHSNPTMAAITFKKQLDCFPISP